MGTPEIWPPTLTPVDERCDFDLDDLAREIAEIGIGSAILGLRQVNIRRRQLVRDVPALEPAVNAVLDQVEAVVEPASAIIGSLVSSLADAMPGSRGEQVHEAGLVIANMGPELLRLSGLTKRD